MKFFPIILFLFSISYFNSFAQEKIELKNAKELSGKVIDGQDVREASGNVEFSQGNVKVYCDNAIQYINANRVELKGNVRIIQDTLSLTTSKATYFGDDKRAFCENGVTLKDPNATLRADNGIYFFNEAKAIFKGDVIIVSPDYRITSEELTYIRGSEDSFAKGNVIVTTDSALIKADKIDFYKLQGKTFAAGNVIIESDSTIITSDTAENNSIENKSFAAGNVKIESLNNSTVIYGNKLENFENENYTIVKDSAVLIQSKEGEDTINIYCDVMEAFRNKPEKYIAKGNVRFIRSDFYSKCGTGIFYKETETLSLSESPIVWQDNLQMTGDSIYAELPNKKLQTIYIRKQDEKYNSINSFVISGNSDESFEDRYDQITGEDITIKFNNDKIELIEVVKNSRSIYFLYEDNKANGLNSIEGENINIYFDEDEKVMKIKVESEPKGDYYPESALGTASLTLPGFDLRTDRPVRK